MSLARRSEPSPASRRQRFAVEEIWCVGTAHRWPALADHELALDALAGGDSGLAEARDAIGVMVRAAQDGGETVRRMLAFARTRQEGPSECVDLGALRALVRETLAGTPADATAVYASE